MEKVSLVPRSEVERIIVANVNYNEEEKKLKFDSNTFINMSKLLEVKTTRRTFNSSYSKLVTSEGKVILLRFRMPRFQVKLDGKVFLKFFNPDELTTIIQDKLSNWIQICSDLTKVALSSPEEHNLFDISEQQEECIASWNREMNRDVDSMIIKLCHSASNSTTVQFDNFKIIIRDDVGEPRLFTSEEILTSEYLESFV
jgi:hypothetical protein